MRITFFFCSSFISLVCVHRPSECGTELEKVWMCCRCYLEQMYDLQCTCHDTAADDLSWQSEATSDTGGVCAERCKPSSFNCVISNILFSQTFFPTLLNKFD